MSSSLKPRTEYELTLSGFAGGLNLRDADYCLSANETSEMKNLLIKTRCGSIWTGFR